MHTFIDYTVLDPTVHEGTSLESDARRHCEPKPDVKIMKCDDKPMTQCDKRNFCDVLRGIEMIGIMR